MSSDISQDDKLWTALAYAFSPLVPIILMFMEDKKNRPYIKFNAVQSLVATVVLSILSTVTCGFGAVLFLIMFWWAYQAYMGQDVRIPWMSDFIRNRPLIAGIVGLLVLFLVLGSFPIVPETKQAVVVRFGKPVRILNRYEAGKPIGAAVDVKSLHAKIGALTLENDFLEGALSKAGLLSAKR